MPRIFFTSCLFLVVCAASVQAHLKFDQEPLEVRPQPEQDQVEATFSFRNISDKPVRVTGLESTCSCLEASVDKETYQPGEKGTGKAVFKVSNFVGRHEKTLHIYTDDSANPDNVLNTVIDVPVVVEIEPKVLKWSLGEAPVPKTFTIRMVGETPIHIKNVNSTRDSVSFEKVEINPGREYQITVTPKNTEKVVIGALRIETDSQYPRYARQMAFYSIVRPDKASATEAKKK